jgi:hypothetical protein
MSSAATVPRRGRAGKDPSGCLPPKRATAQPVWGEIVARFTAAALQSRPIRICLVSPWLTETDHGRLRLLAHHADGHGAELVVITRTPTTRDGHLALELVGSARSHRVLISDSLHAKLYISQEADGRGVALVGSANMTAGGTRLAEAGVLLRPLADSRLMDDLIHMALTQLGAYRPATRRPS